MNTKKHTLVLESRSALSITEVDDVISFDETLVSLQIGENILNISGEELSIKNLSLENREITVNGNISAVVYFDESPRKRRRLLGR
ncbi:MAG: YabP/YqfC family sporulation protein [Clostridia bacterium]|nr:YabP/YqfC family sporulation protein [Clostridia bacterium]